MSSDSAPSQPSASIGKPFTYGSSLDQQSHTSKGALGPFNADSPSSPGRGALRAQGAQGESSQSPRSFNTGEAATGQKSFSPAIASTSTTPFLDNASLFTPASFPTSSSLSASDLAVSKPSTGPRNEPPFIQNPLRHGDLQQAASSGAPPGVYNALRLSKSPAQQNITSIPPHTTTAAADSLHSASATPANNPSTSADGIHHPNASLSSNSPAVVNKPVLKMKRTGQSFPLNSNTGSSRQRSGSYSPNRRLASVPGSSIRKASDLATKGGQEPLRNGEQRPIGADPSEELGGPFKVQPQKSIRLSEIAGSDDALPNPSRGSTDDRNSGNPNATTANSDTDDIIYEATAQTGQMEGVLEDIVDNGSSSDDSDSQSDDDDDDEGDDETMDMDPRKASFRQLFRAPDQGDQYDDSEEDTEDDSQGEDDDDATSVSSSGDSSVADEPAVALPSARIQHQEAYPATILEMAEPGRLYTEWRMIALAITPAAFKTYEITPEDISLGVSLTGQISHGRMDEHMDQADPSKFESFVDSEFLDKGAIIKAGPALFPVGYSKCATYSGFPWICAVRSCRLLYKTPAGLANHARFTHKKAMFNDNMDGTVSLVGSYSKKNQSGRNPPVVVSKRPLDPKEPPMREPSVPAGKQLSKSKMARLLAKKALPSPVFEGNDVVMGDGDGDTDSLEPQDPPLPPVTADPRSSELWKYIHPFLSVHKSLPDKNWAQHIVRLPRIRDIIWNKARIKEHPYKDSHPRDVTALLVQITGVESSTPCKYCAQGRGPFVGCIVISPEASNEAKGAVLSCANCYYHCGQSQCSLCKDAVARRAPRVRPGQELGSYNVKLLTERAHRKPTKAKMNQPQAFLSSTTSLGGPARPGLKLYMPSEFKSIEKASTERTYKVIKGLNGKEVLMCGALIPEKYDLDRTLPSYPWVCPIRSCRRVFKKIASLGSHFVRGHPGCLLNDNQDGTLSQIGFYNTPQPGSNGLPALVISKNPLDPQEGPMKSSGLPGQANHAPKASKHKLIIKKPLKIAQIPLGQQVATSKPKNLWDYMLPYLPKAAHSISSDPRILTLLSLPRKRDLQCRMKWETVAVYGDKKHILGLIIYLSGEKHKNGEASCTFCANQRGPFPTCMTLTNGVPEDARSLVKCCANCVFTHNISSCSIKDDWSKETLERSLPNATARKRAWVTDDESEEPAATRRRSDRLGLPDEKGSAKQKQKIVTLPLKRNAEILSSREAAPEPVQTSVVGNGGAAKSEPSTALIHAGQVQPDDLLEMEDWEIAPGRIRGAGMDGVNKTGIAYSKSYLETNQAVRVSRDVTFEVKAIKSGNNLELEADQTKTRYCTLASGKLYVTVKEQEPFTIGPHGLFKVAPGCTAKIQNRLYIDSVLHISTYADG